VQAQINVQVGEFLKINLHAVRNRCAGTISKVVTYDEHPKMKRYFLGEKSAFIWAGWNVSSKLINMPVLLFGKLEHVCLTQQSSATSEYA
jgi:hypothetical protein